VYITHDFRILSDYTTQIYDLQVKSNGKMIKIDQIKICVKFEIKW